jgi:hypothetical protein
MFNTTTLSTNQSEPINMKLIISHAFSLVFLTLALLSVTACQSSPQKHQAKLGDSTAEDAAALAAKQKEYDQLLAEWKTLKPGLQRLLSIEGELNLLIGQLDELSASLSASQTSSPTLAIDAHNGPAPDPVAGTASNTKYIVAPTTTAITTPSAPPRAIPAVKPEKETPRFAEKIIPATFPQTVQAAPQETAQNLAQENNQADANYALQLASITELRGLPKVWNQMLNKNPTLLANLEPNFQKTNVKNTDYYRLKVGGFSTQSEASQKCSDLKAVGVACLVVNYTSSNFEQLTSLN